MADTPYQGFIGATYGGDARHLSAEQCINLYPEPTGAPGTTPKRPLAFAAHPRTESLWYGRQRPRAWGLLRPWCRA